MKKTTRKKLGWHFVSATLSDGRAVPPDGEWLEHEGSLVMCQNGLHLSLKAIQALGYAPGHTICRVEYGGNVLNDTDKLVCSRRKILWRVNGEKLLRDFARACALDVIGLWEAPQFVRQYLETGDEAIRAATWAAARAAAMDAARDDAAWDAARAATWAAAGAAAGAAARAAAWDDAAWEAAMDAAWEAAGAAARDAQNKRLEKMINEARP